MKLLCATLAAMIAIAVSSDDAHFRGSGRRLAINSGTCSGTRSCGSINYGTTPNVLPPECYEIACSAPGMATIKFKNCAKLAVGSTLSYIDVSVPGIGGSASTCIGNTAGWTMLAPNTLTPAITVPCSGVGTTLKVNYHDGSFKAGTGTTNTGGCSVPNLVVLCQTCSFTVTVTCPGNGNYCSPEGACVKTRAKITDCACGSPTYYGAERTCRTATGSSSACDTDEVCDGSADCPTDDRMTNFNANKVCRGVTNPNADAACETAETCQEDGSCPNDDKEMNYNANKVCRGVTNPNADAACETAETCQEDGSCPNDDKEMNYNAGTVCRAPVSADSVPACDTPEHCAADGACPADDKKPTGTVCEVVNKDTTCEYNMVCSDSATCDRGSCPSSPTDRFRF